MRSDGNSNTCRWVRDGFTQVDNASDFMGHGPRQMFALANMSGKYVAVTGGYIDSKSQYLYSSHRYDVMANAWEDLPNMNLHREGHASCFIANNLYVFCGINANKDPINSIEFLSDACGALNTLQSW